MNLLDLTPRQLKRAAAIKEHIEKLNKELRGMFGISASSADASVGGKRTMSASARKRIAAAQKARWAKVRGAKRATLPVKSAAKAKKRRMATATRRQLSAKLKAYWAAKKVGKK